MDNFYSTKLVMKRHKPVMNNYLVHLSFALPSFEDPLSAAMAHNTLYDELYIAADLNHCAHFICELPNDAHEGDVISLSATNITARDAQYFIQYRLTQKDIEAGVTKLSFNHITNTNEYVLQLMLHGLHATLKDCMEFDAYIKAFACGYQSNQPEQPVANHSPSFKSTFMSLSIPLLSLF